MESWNESHIVAQLADPVQRQKAFTQVVNHFKEQLYWQIRRMVFSHDDADDVLQNTFLKAWMGLENFRGDAQLSTWLYRIANNETLNFLLKKKHETSMNENTDISLASQLIADPYFDGDETEAQLQEAISLLPPKQRQVFNLKYYEQMKYEDMSELLHTSTGSLKASYHHAVKKISDYFHHND